MFTFTDMAFGYSVDELDDLTDRKVAPEGIDGDRLARIIRARRGTARATGQVDPFPTLAATGERIDTGATVRYEYSGNRRMAAVGGTGAAGLFEETYVTDDEHVFTWVLGEGNARFVRRGR